MDATSIGWRAARRRLLAWFRRTGRDLPWRRTRDPYAIWVSEVMLQQTRVATVVPFYGAFLARFPDVQAVARARRDSVLAAWSGLGYYRRARNLHAAARVMAREGVPSTRAGWQALPGVGAYTAAAVASIAFGERAAVLDGNVARVVCRLHAVPKADRRVRAFLDAWLSARAPGAHNQALMELGATVCTPRGPACGRCPLRAQCRGRADPERHPEPRAPARLPTEHRTVGFCLRGAKVRLARRDAPGPVQGMWDLPPAPERGRLLATVRHGLYDRTLHLEVRRACPGAEGRWFDARAVLRIPLATAARKCLEAVGFLRPGSGRAVV